MSATNLSDYEIEPPYRYKNYLIFPNTIFQNINISDCNDSLNGMCLEKVKSIEECIDTATAKNQISGAGYFIQGKYGNFCAQTRTDLHPFLNPALRLRRKDTYPELENMNVWTYIDTKLYPFPPDNARDIFYKDYFILQNVETSEYVIKAQGDDSNIVLTKNKGLATLLQLLPFRNTALNEQNYMPARQHYKTLINSIGTNLIFKRGLDKVVWSADLAAVSNDETAFIFHDVKTETGQDDLEREIKPINFSQTFYITFNHTFTIYADPETETLKLHYGNIKSAREDGLAITFRLIPRVMVYYCENGKIKEGSLDSLPSSLRIYRNPIAWGLCKTQSKTNYIPFLVILITLLMLITAYYFRIRKPQTV